MPEQLNPPQSQLPEQDPYVISTDRIQEYADQAVYLHERAVQGELLRQDAQLSLDALRRGKVAVGVSEPSLLAIADDPDKLQYRASRYEDTSRKYDEKASEHMAAIRQVVNSLDVHQKTKLDFVINSYASPFLAATPTTTEEQAISREEAPPVRPAKGYADWLANDASDEQVMNFLQWHTSELSKQNQDEEVLVAIDTEKQNYREAVERGIAEGWLHPHAAEALEELDITNVYIGDFFDTILKGWEGYYMDGAGYVVIAQGMAVYTDEAGSVPADERTEMLVEDVIENIRSTLSHEMNHALLGRLGPRWLNEAVTEHIAQVMKHGEVEYVKPVERDEGPVSYYEPERNLLDTLLHDGGEWMSSRLVTRAYSSAPGDKAAELELMNSMDEIWGVRDTLQHVNTMVAAYEKAYLQQGHTARQSEVRAVQQVRADLLLDPAKVFGSSYKKPVLQNA